LLKFQNGFNKNTYESNRRYSKTADVVENQIIENIGIDEQIIDSQNAETSEIYDIVDENQYRNLEHRQLLGKVIELENKISISSKREVTHFFSLLRRIVLNF
jgi:hypothetical protein